MPLSLSINDVQDVVMQVVKQYSEEIKDIWMKRVEEMVAFILQRFIAEVEEGVMEILQNEQNRGDLEINKSEKLGKEVAIDLVMVLMYFPDEILGKKRLYRINLWVLHRRKPAEDVAAWVFGRSLQAYYLQKLQTRYKI